MAEKQSRIFAKGPGHEKAGVRVTTLDGLSYLAMQRRSVFMPIHAAWKSPRPAAWVIQLPGVVLMGLFAEGMYVYEKDKSVESTA